MAKMGAIILENQAEVKTMGLAKFDSWYIISPDS